jgi:hypothetical protein
MTQSAKIRIVRRGGVGDFTPAMDARHEGVNLPLSRTWLGGGAYGCGPENRPDPSR